MRSSLSIVASVLIGGFYLSNFLESGHGVLVAL